MPGEDRSSLECCTRFLMTAGRTKRPGIRLRQQKIAQRTFAANRFEKPGLGLARDASGQARVAQVAVDQQARAPRCASSEAKFLATVDLPSFGSTEMTPTIFGLRSPSARSTATLAERRVSEKLESGWSIE